MAARRVPPKKHKAPPPPPPPRGSAADGLGTFVVYVLAVAGGLHLGVQAYNHRAELAPAARTASNEHAVQPERSPEREQTRRRRSRKSLVETPARQAPAHDHDGPERDEPTGAAATPEPSADPVTAVPPREIDRGSGRRPEVALTFDAGSDYRPVVPILEALAADGARATFFLTGDWVRRNPATTRRIAGEGHELGNHSWDHSNFTALADDEIRDQLRRTEAMVQQVAGRSTRPYFRPPLGARNRHVLEILGSEGYFSVYWTLDSRDSVDQGITAEQIRDRVREKVEAGSIVLLHCGSQPTADALPEILAGLRAQGLAQVPISQLLRD